MTSGITVRASMFYMLASGLTHGATLSLFALASRTEWASAGKIVALSLTLLSAIALLTAMLRGAKSLTASMIAAACLALGYLMAFFSLGAFFLPGLLNDSSPISFGYALSVLGVFGFTFLIYWVCAIAVLLMLRWTQWAEHQIAP